MGVLLQATVYRKSVIEIMGELESPLGIKLPLEDTLTEELDILFVAYLQRKNLTAGTVDYFVLLSHSTTPLRVVSLVTP